MPAGTVTAVVATDSAPPASEFTVREPTSVPLPGVLLPAER